MFVLFYFLVEFWGVLFRLLIWIEVLLTLRIWIVLFSVDVAQLIYTNSLKPWNRFWLCSCWLLFYHLKCEIFLFMNLNAIPYLWNLICFHSIPFHSSDFSIMLPCDQLRLASLFSYFSLILFTFSCQINIVICESSFCIHAVWWVSL